MLVTERNVIIYLLYSKLKTNKSLFNSVPQKYFSWNYFLLLPKCSTIFQHKESMGTERGLVSPFNLLNSTLELNENTYLLIWKKRKTSTKKPIIAKEKNKIQRGCSTKWRFLLHLLSHISFTLKKSPGKNNTWNFKVTAMKYNTG